MLHQASNRVSEGNSLYERFFPDGFEIATTNESKLAEFREIPSLIFQESVGIRECSQGESLELQPNDEQLSLMSEGLYQRVSAEILEDKLGRVFQSAQRPVVVVDTSLYIDALDGHPGPGIKMFLAKDNIGVRSRMLCSGAHDKNSSSDRAEFIESIGIQFSDKSKLIVTGSMPGRISKEPSPMKGFGFDDIFIPDPSKQVEIGLATDCNSARTLTELIHNDSSDGNPIKHLLSGRTVAMTRLGKELGIVLSEEGQAILQRYEHASFGKLTEFHKS